VVLSLIENLQRKKKKRKRKRERKGKERERRRRGERLRLPLAVKEMKKVKNSRQKTDFLHQEQVY